MALKALTLSAYYLLVACTLTGCWSYVSREAQIRFERQHQHRSITVYPVNVARMGRGTAADAQLGSALVAWLNSQGMATAKLARPGVPIAVNWHANQAKMAEQSATAFGDWVRQAEIGSDYALLVEILCTASEDKVVGVQYYLAEKSGLIAAGGLANSHWDEFKQNEPVDRHGGLAVVKLLLSRRWSELDQRLNHGGIEILPTRASPRTP